MVRKKLTKEDIKLSNIVEFNLWGTSRTKKKKADKLYAKNYHKMFKIVGKK